MSRLAQHAGSPITVGHLTDASLRRLAKRYRRALEDIADGDQAPGREHAVRGWLRDVESEQQLRAVLRESWLAREDGTDSYTDFISAGGLATVERCHGLAPSYSLAVFLDRWMFLLACEHVLAWPDEPLAAATRERYAGGLITAECPRCERDHADDPAVRP